MQLEHGICAMRRGDFAAAAAAAALPPAGAGDAPPEPETNCQKGSLARAAGTI